MPDRRSVLRAILLGSAGVALPSGLAALGGCGVPTGGGPEVDGPGPSAGTAGGSGPGGTPPSPDTAVSPEDLVAKYLLAVAGQLDDSYREKLQDSARTFMTSGAAGDWSPEPNITVVRVGNFSHREGGTSTWVDVTLRPVGQLSANGMLKPIDTEAVICNFEVVNDRTNNQSNDAWRIQQIQPTSLANAMLLDSNALDDPVRRLFVPQLVYYWSSTGQNALVPDLRYLPLVGPDQNRYSRIVTDLVSEPSSWLAVTPFPNGTGLPQATTDDKGDLSVTIKLPTPDAIDHNRLMTQLRASLDPLYTRTLQLQIINSQKQQSSGGEGYRTANLADSPARNGADPYCVAGGAVRPLHEGTRLPTVLDSPQNKDVVLAGLSRDKRMVAVVRQTAGHYGLWIGDDETGPEYRECAGLPEKSTAYGRPIWLPGQPAGQERIILLVADRLYAVDRASASASNITPVGVRRVQAFSVAPDGRRIALIADGVPEIAALTPTDQKTTIGPPQQINVPDLVPGTFTAVAWSRLERVVVAGRLSGSTDTFSIFEVTIDGAITRQFREVDSREQITHLAAYPPRPVDQSASMGWVLGQAGSGKSAYSFQIEREQYNRLAQLQVTPSASPSASASPKPANLVPMAPFFAD